MKLIASEEQVRWEKSNAGGPPELSVVLPCLNEARTLSDPARRKKAYEAALAQVEVDRPLIYIYHPTLLFAQTAKLEGYKQPSDGIIRLQDMKLAR